MLCAEPTTLASFSPFHLGCKNKSDQASQGYCNKFTPSDRHNATCPITQMTTSPSATLAVPAAPISPPSSNGVLEDENTLTNEDQVVQRAAHVPPLVLTTEHSVISPNRPITTFLDGSTHSTVFNKGSSADIKNLNDRTSASSAKIASSKEVNQALCKIRRIGTYCKYKKMKEKLFVLWEHAETPFDQSRLEYYDFPSVRRSRHKFSIPTTPPSQQPFDPKSVPKKISKSLPNTSLNGKNEATTDLTSQESLLNTYGYLLTSGRLKPRRTIYLKDCFNIGPGPDTAREQAIKELGHNLSPENSDFREYGWEFGKESENNSFGVTELLAALTAKSQASNDTKGSTRLKLSNSCRRLRHNSTNSKNNSKSKNVGSGWYLSTYSQDPHDCLTFDVLTRSEMQAWLDDFCILHQLTRQKSLTFPLCPAYEWVWPINVRARGINAAYRLTGSYYLCLSSIDNLFTLYKFHQYYDEGRDLERDEIDNYYYQHQNEAKIESNQNPSKVDLSSLLSTGTKAASQSSTNTKPTATGSHTGVSKSNRTFNILNRQDVQIAYVELCSIKRCGYSRDYFYVELGRTSSLGSGELWFRTEHPLDSIIIHHFLLKRMKIKSDESTDLLSSYPFEDASNFPTNATIDNDTSLGHSKGGTLLQPPTVGPLLSPSSQESFNSKLHNISNVNDKNVLSTSNTNKITANLFKSLFSKNHNKHDPCSIDNSHIIVGKKSMKGHPCDNNNSASSSSGTLTYLPFFLPLKRNSSSSQPKPIGEVLPTQEEYNLNQIDNTPEGQRSMEKTQFSPKNDSISNEEIPRAMKINEIQISNSLSIDENIISLSPKLPYLNTTDKHNQSRIRHASTYANGFHPSTISEEDDVVNTSNLPSTSNTIVLTHLPKMEGSPVLEDSSLHNLALKIGTSVSSSTYNSYWSSNSDRSRLSSNASNFSSVEGGATNPLNSAKLFNYTPTTNKHSHMLKPSDELLLPPTPAFRDRSVTHDGLGARLQLLKTYCQLPPAHSLSGDINGPSTTDPNLGHSRTNSTNSCNTRNANINERSNQLSPTGQATTSDYTHYRRGMFSSQDSGYVDMAPSAQLKNPTISNTAAQPILEASPVAYATMSPTPQSLNPKSPGTIPSTNIPGQQNANLTATAIPSLPDPFIFSRKNRSVDELTRKIEKVRSFYFLPSTSDTPTDDKMENENTIEANTTPINKRDGLEPSHNLVLDTVRPSSFSVHSRGPTSLANFFNTELKPRSIKNIAMRQDNSVENNTPPSNANNNLNVPQFPDTNISPLVASDGASSSTGSFGSISLERIQDLKRKIDDRKNKNVETSYRHRQKSNGLNLAKTPPSILPNSPTRPLSPRKTSTSSPGFQNSCHSDSDRPLKSRTSLTASESAPEPPPFPAFFFSTPPPPAPPLGPIICPSSARHSYPRGNKVIFSNNNLSPTLSSDSSRSRNNHSTSASSSMFSFHASHPHHFSAGDKNFVSDEFEGSSSFNDSGHRLPVLDELTSNKFVDLRKQHQYVVDPRLIKEPTESSSSRGQPKSHASTSSFSIASHQLFGRSDNLQNLSPTTPSLQNRLFPSSGMPWTHSGTNGTGNAAVSNLIDDADDRIRAYSLGSKPPPFSFLRLLRKKTNTGMPNILPLNGFKTLSSRLLSSSPHSPILSGPTSNRLTPPTHLPSMPPTNNLLRCPIIEGMVIQNFDEQFSSGSFAQLDMDTNRDNVDTSEDVLPNEQKNIALK